MPRVKVQKVKRGAVLRGVSYTTVLPDGTPFEGFVPYEAGDTQADLAAKIRLHYRVAVRAAQGPADDPALADAFEFDL